MNWRTRWPIAVGLSVGCLGLAAAALLSTRSGTPAAHAAPPLAVVAAQAVGADGYGTITGRLVYGGSEAPAPAPLTVDKDTSVCGKGGPLLDRKLIVDPKTKGVRWGLAYVVNPKGENLAAVEALVKKHPTVELDQKFCEYVPFVIGMNEGQTLLLKSSDDVNHNVHLNAFTNENFNVILPPNGDKTAKLVPEKRPLTMTCDIHPWMKAYIMVYSHPFFAVTDADGTFKIEGVPAGAQKVVIWQPAVGYATEGLAAGMPVTVEAGKEAKIGEVKLDPAKVK